MTTDRRLYRFDMNTAYQIGERRHPQKVILELAPDATDLEGVPIGDCWMFRAAAIAHPPSYVIDVAAQPQPPDISDAEHDALRKMLGTFVGPDGKRYGLETRRAKP